MMGGRAFIQITDSLAELNELTVNLISTKHRISLLGITCFSHSRSEPPHCTGASNLLKFVRARSMFGKR